MQDGRVSHLEHVFIRGGRIRWENVFLLQQASSQNVLFALNRAYLLFDKPLALLSQGWLTEEQDYLYTERILTNSEIELYTPVKSYRAILRSKSLGRKLRLICTLEMDGVLLKGHTCRFMIIPDMLKNAPMFKRIDPKLKVNTLTSIQGKAIHPHSMSEVLFETRHYFCSHSASITDVVHSCSIYLLQTHKFNHQESW